MRLPAPHRPVAVDLPSGLLAAAALAWLLSLALPGFVVETRAQPLPGAEILVFGLLFGWLGHGWAAYANLFFLYAAYRLFRGGVPRIAVTAMALLAATLPLFKGVLRDEGSDAILPVVSWGWGALVWIGALVLLAAALLARAQVLGRRGAWGVAGVLALAAAALAGVHHQQWRQANLQEGELFLSRGMAFTKAVFCGVALAWPERSLLTPDEAVTLDIDPALRQEGIAHAALGLPALSHYTQDGFTWRLHRDPLMETMNITQRSPARATGPVLQARPTAQGAVIRLLLKDTGAVGYEQFLKLRTDKAGHPTYCPLASHQGWKDLPHGHDQGLLRALGQQHDAEAKVAPVTFAAETGRERCDIGKQDIDGIKGLRHWDGRQVILHDALRSRVSFCSARHIALLYLSSNGGAQAGNLSPIVTLFDRQTLKRVAVFNDRQVCHMGRCQEAARELITGFRLAGDTAVIETTQGDYQAQRYDGR